MQKLEAFPGFLLRPKLFQFDPVVVPIQFFAQVADLAHVFALACFSHRQALPALKNHFDHAARSVRAEGAPGAPSLSAVFHRKTPQRPRTTCGLRNSVLRETAASLDTNRAATARPSSFRAQTFREPWQTVRVLVRSCPAAR